MIRTTSFLRAYRAFPHWLINGAAMTVARQTRPQRMIDAAVRAWIERESIDMNDFEPGPFASLEHFFLRRLRPGARPLGEGVVSPVDGCVVGSGAIERGTILQVKGTELSVDRVVNGKLYDLPVSPLEGGTYLTLFLRPRGYHYVHAPCDLVVEEVRFLPGRFFPQNEDALRHIPGIYERNERAVLCVRIGEVRAFLVMVGASVVGGIHVRGVGESERSGIRRLDRRVAKGEELGHFSFGSTVVLLLPPEARAVTEVALGEEVPMGRSLFASSALS